MFVQEKIKQVQAITKFCQDPCHAPWTVYMELARAPAGKLILQFISFGLDDVIRGLIRPKGIYPLKRTGRRRGRRGKVKGIPELGEMLGHNIPGAETLAVRKFGNTTRWLWVIDGVLQRILFWFMIVDLVTDFLYEWTTLIGKTEYCHAGRLTGAASCDVALAVLSPAAFPLPLGCDYLHKSWGDFAGCSPAHVSSPSSVYCASITVKALPMQDFGSLSVWIAPIGHPENRIGPIDTQTMGMDWLATATAAADLPGPGIYAAYASVTGPNIAWITGGQLSGFAYY